MMHSTQNLEVLTYRDYPKEPVEMENISLEFMKKACFVPIAVTDGTFEIAMADTKDFNTIAALKFAYGLEIRIKQGKKDDILDAIDRLYGTGRQSLETIIEEAGKDMANGGNGEQEDESHLRDLASEAPIIRLVNRFIVDAVEMDASDIHFEPYEDEFKVRYRIDGVLSDVDSPPKQFQAAIISRVKLMAKLNISERRLPQDGRIKLRIRDKEVDFRVSTVPTLFGESLVMRILNRETLLLDLQKLGFPQSILEQYVRLASQPYGMIPFEFTGKQNHNPGRSRGIPAARHQPDSDKSQNRPHLRKRAAIHGAPGPGYNPGGRNP